MDAQVDSIAVSLLAFVFVFYLYFLYLYLCQYLSTLRFYDNYDNNHGGGEGRLANCYYLIADPGHLAYAGLWDDRDCLLSLNYICERTVPPTANKLI